MKARIRTYRTFHFFDSTAVVVDPSLLTFEILNPDDTSFATPVVTQNAVTPNLHLAAEVVFTNLGTYTLKWYYNLTLIASEQVAVGYDPVPDYRLNVANDLRYSYAAGEVITAKLIGSDGAQVGADLAAVYNAATLSYEVVAHVFTVVGDYFLVWYREIAAVPTPDATDYLFIQSPRATFSSTVILGSDGTYLNNVLVVISEADGTPVFLGTTDAVGQMHVDLEAGDYIVSLQRTGIVYSLNNMEIEVRDPDLDDSGNNQFLFEVGFFIPTFALPAPPSGMTTLFLNLFGMDGRPFANAQVMITLIDPPTVLVANTVWDTALTYCTDATGYVSFDLVEGITVEVSITPLSLRRRFTVPVSGAAVNMMTLISGADDAFDIQAITTPDAPRRNF